MCNKRYNLKLKTKINSLVPSVLFLDIFPLFVSKKAFLSTNYFDETIFMTALHFSTNFSLYAKNWRPIWQKKRFFFDFLKLRRLESVILGKKFFENFWSVWRPYKASPPPAVIDINQKVARDISLYVEKLKLLA